MLPTLNCRCQQYTILLLNFYFIFSGYVDIRPVLLKPHPINTTVRHGEMASIQCKVRSASTPTVKWIKGIDTRAELSNSYSTDKLFRLENKMYLILPNKSARINSRVCHMALLLLLFFHLIFGAVVGHNDDKRHEIIV